MTLYSKYIQHGVQFEHVTPSVLLVVYSLEILMASFDFVFMLPPNMSAKGFPSERRSSEALLCAVPVSPGAGPNRSTMDCEGAGAAERKGLFAAEFVGD